MARDKNESSYNYKKEYEFYHIYRGAFLPNFNEDILELSEPMEVREYAQLFQSTLVKIIEEKNNLPIEGLTEKKNQEILEQLEKIHEKFIDFAIASAKKEGFPYKSPYQLIRTLQKEIDILRAEHPFHVQLLPTYERIQNILTSAASSEVVFVMELRNKLPQLEDAVTDKYLTAFRNIGTLINRLEQEKKPHFEIKSEDKIQLLQELRTQFLTFSNTTMSLDDLIKKVNEFKDNTDLYDHRIFFKSSPTHLIDEVIQLLKEIQEENQRSHNP